MTRSAQALERRAAKRNVSIKEQRVKDGSARKTKGQGDSRMKEPGAWRCPSCGNHNFASRRTCHSVTCSQQQPSQSKGAVVRQERQAADKVHKEQWQRRLCRQERQAASWKIPQADTATLATNQQLRQRYLADDAQLTPKERERAKVLLARDERKRLKKQQQQRRGGKAG